MLGIYQIICTKNGKIYVGRSVDIEKRLKRHFRSLEKGNHENVLLQHDFNKFGRAAFKLKVKTQPNEEASKVAEQYYIDTLENQYNIGMSSVCGDNLTRHPDREEIITRRNKSCKESMARTTAEERIARYSNAGEDNGMFGKTHTKKARKKISEAHTGNQYAKGAVRSAEQRKRMSEVASARTGEANAFYGKSHSDETKEKIRQANKGRLPPNTLKVKVGKKVYESATAAAKEIGCSVASIGNRIKNPNFPEYCYVS